MKTVVIDRNTWLRGEGVEESFLLRGSDGKRCCVGFVCQQFGVPDEDIEFKRTFRTEFNIPELEWLVCGYRKTDDGQKIYNGNDSTDVSDADREIELASLFLKHGIQLEFIN